MWWFYPVAYVLITGSLGYMMEPEARDGVQLTRWDGALAGVLFLPVCGTLVVWKTLKRGMRIVFG